MRTTGCAAVVVAELPATLAGCATRPAGCATAVVVPASWQASARCAARWRAAGRKLSRCVAASPASRSSSACSSSATGCGARPTALPPRRCLRPRPRRHSLATPVRARRRGCCGMARCCSRRSAARASTASRALRALACGRASRAAVQAARRRSRWVRRLPTRRLPTRRPPRRPPPRHTRARPTGKAHTAARCPGWPHAQPPELTRPLSASPGGRRDVLRRSLSCGAVGRAG